MSGCDTHKNYADKEEISPSLQITGEAMEFLDCCIRLLATKTLSDLFNRQTEIIRDVFNYFNDKYSTTGRLKNLPDISTYPCDHDIDLILALRRCELVCRGVMQIRRDLICSGIDKIRLIQSCQAIELALRRLSLPAQKASFLVNRLKAEYVEFTRDYRSKAEPFLNDQESVVVYTFDREVLNSNSPEDITLSLINKAVQIVLFTFRNSAAYAISALQVAATIATVAHMLDWYAQELYPILADWLSNSSATEPRNLLKDLYNIAWENNIVNFPSIYSHRVKSIYNREVRF